MRTFIALTIVWASLVGIALTSAPPGCSVERESRGSPSSLVRSCVFVTAGDNMGSGVVLKRDNISFVWTAAHVVEDAMEPCGAFSDVMVTQDDIEGGRKVGQYQGFAQVLRYSPRHDLALLVVRKRAWPQKGVTFVGEAHIPRIGSPIWHVGCMRGERGINSVARGHIGAIGRLRLNFKPNELQGLVYDQVSVTGHAGCSGGGVFEADAQGRCVGLVTEYLGPGQTPGAMCLVPARRIWSFARETECLWGLGKGEVPAQFGKVVWEKLPY